MYQHFCQILSRQSSVQPFRCNMILDGYDRSIDTNKPMITQRKKHCMDHLSKGVGHVRWLRPTRFTHLKVFCFVLFVFFLRSTFVGSAWSFVFSSPTQRPMTSHFEGFLYQILSITLISYLNSWNIWSEN